MKKKEIQLVYTIRMTDLVNFSSQIYLQQFIFK